MHRLLIQTSFYRGHQIIGKSDSYDDMAVLPMTDLSKPQLRRPWRVFTDVASPIIAITSTQKYAYVATRARSLFQYPIEQLRSALRSDEDVTMRNFINESVVRLFSVTIGDKAAIVVQGDTGLYYLREEDFAKAAPKRIDTLKAVKCSAACPHSGHFIVADNQFVYRFAYTSDGIKEQKKQAHGMRDVSTIVCGWSQTIMWERREFKIMNRNLDIIKGSPIPKPLRACSCMPGSDTFIAVLQDGQVILGREACPSLKLSDDMVCFKVRNPYTYVMSLKALEFRSTLRIADIEEVVNVPPKAKTVVMEVLDDYVILCAADSQLVAISNKYTKEHMEHLMRKKNCEAAIAICSALDPSVRDQTTLTGMYERYGDDLFAKNMFPQAFVQFRKSRQSPFKVIARFRKFVQGDGFEKAVTEDLRIQTEKLERLRKLLDGNVIPEMIQDAIDNLDVPNAISSISDMSMTTRLIAMCESDISAAKEAAMELKLLFPTVHGPPMDEGQAVVQLGSFLEERMKVERQSTRAKVYNTVIVQCLMRAAKALTRVQDFVTRKPPLFFDFAAEALLKGVDGEDRKPFLTLCEQYRKHDIALQYLVQLARDKDDVPLIKYVCNSVDFIDIACDAFPAVSEPLKTASPDDVPHIVARCAHMFCSGQLVAYHVGRVMQVIDDVKDVPTSMRNQISIRFLIFAALEMKVATELFHERLINLYLGELEEDVRWRKNVKYCPISGEKEPLKTMRYGLLRVLDESNLYDAKRVILKIPDVLLDEKLAAMRKARMIHECIKLVVGVNTELSIARTLILDMCDKIYTLDYKEAREVYNTMFFALCEVDTEQSREKIRVLLNERAEMINPVRILACVPTEMTLVELEPFICATGLLQVNSVRNMRIRNALLSVTVEGKRRQLRTLREGSVQVSDSLKCNVCGKAIGRSQFYVMSNNCVVHAACTHTLDC